MLALSGIDEQVQRDAGLTSRAFGVSDGTFPPDLPSGVLLPVLARDGTRATLRLFPDPDPLGVQPIDLAQFERDAPRLLDDCEGLRLPVPFVASPAVLRSSAVIVSSHDLWALALATRTGLVTVSAFGHHLLERAVALATQMASGAPVILALHFGPPFPRGMLRRATAMAGAFGRDVRIATWSGRSIAGVPPSPLVEAQSFKPSRWWGQRRLLVPGAVGVLRTEGAGALASGLVGRVVAAGMRVLMSRASGPASLPAVPGAASTGDLMRTAAEIQALATTHGATAVVTGGVAIDAIVGRQVRTRKDLDVLMAGGGRDSLEAVTEALVARGFEVDLRRVGYQSGLRRGNLLVDLIRLIETEDGALHVSPRAAFTRLGARDWFVSVECEGVSVRVLAPRLLHRLKLYKLAGVENFRLRSHWERSAADRTDLAALRSEFTGREGDLRCGSAEVERVSAVPFRARSLPRFLRLGRW